MHLDIKNRQQGDPRAGGSELCRTMKGSLSQRGDAMRTLSLKKMGEDKWSSRICLSDQTLLSGVSRLTPTCHASDRDDQMDLCSLLASSRSITLKGQFKI